MEKKGRFLEGLRRRSDQRGVGGGEGAQGQGPVGEGKQDSGRSQEESVDVTAMVWAPVPL